MIFCSFNPIYIDDLKVVSNEKKGGSERCQTFTIIIASDNYTGDKFITGIKDNTEQ
jgi:hypothetical protein